MGATGIAAAELQLTAACCKTPPSSSSQQCSKSRNYSRHSSIGPSSRAASALRRWGRIDPLVSSTTCGRWVPIIRCREAEIGGTTRLTGLDERRGGGEFRGKRGRRSMAVQTSWGKLEAPRPTFVALEQITGDEHLDKILSEALERNEPIVIDWLAAWCRKCIYLKPKLEKLAAEYHPGIKFYYVDVNTVPQTLVKRADVTKMPTVQLWKNGERVAEVIGGHQVWLVLEEVREMIDLKK